MYHGSFEDLVLRWELDELAVRNAEAIHQRFRRLFLYLRDHPDAQFEGRLISDLIVEEAARLSRANRGDAFGLALDRAGYTIQDGVIRRTLPEMLDLPAADDEVHGLLAKHNLATPLGHLDQAIDSHARGNWAAANSQARSFLESLLDEIAYLLIPGVPTGQTQGEARRQALANRQPPFLSTPLFEWSSDGKDLIHGIFKRLNPQGSHPGLSDEEDSTFRLHFVLLLGRLLLRRLDALI